MNMYNCTLYGSDYIYIHKYNVGTYMLIRMN